MMNKKIAVTFLDKFDITHRLTYKIYNSGLGAKWLKILDENLKNNDSYIHSFFMNQTEDDFPKLITEMNSTVSSINSCYDRWLPTFQETTFINQDVLNTLHEEYEIYGDRVETLIEEDNFDRVLHDSFLSLNELIHACEIILEAKNYSFYPMSVLVDYYPQGIYQAINDIDRLYLKSTFEWGKLYLGYNTLGKDWLEISQHNDLDVILRNQVRSQKRFSAESWFSFLGDSQYLNPLVKFEQWYESLSDELKEKIPIHNLNELSLGRFEIGSLIIDNYFLKYHDKKDDWAVPRHVIKDKWNREVFSTFRKVIDIRRC